MVQLKNFKLSDEAGIYVDDRLQLFDSKSLSNYNSVIIPVNSTGVVTVVVRDHSNNHSTCASVYMNTTGKLMVYMQCELIVYFCLIIECWCFAGRMFRCIVCKRSVLSCRFLGFSRI